MEQRAVPGVVGLPATTAEAVLRATGFRMSPSAPIGNAVHVQSQAPPAGTPMAVGSSVAVFLGSQ